MNTLFDSVWNNGYMRNKILTMRLIVFFLLNLLLQGLFYQMSFCNSLFENYGAKIKICNLQIRHDIMPDTSTYDVTVYLDRYYGPIWWELVAENCFVNIKLQFCQTIFKIILDNKIISLHTKNIHDTIWTNSRSKCEPKNNTWILELNTSFVAK